MAWADSRAFVATIEDILENTTAIDKNADTFKAALYDNTVVPDRTVASASTAYNAGTWAGGHVSDATGWPSVGRDLLSVASGIAGGVYTFDAADTVSANSTTTLANVFGTQVYDDTIAAPVADQGISFHYFGGSQSVTSGTFTINWHPSGLITYTT
jgi:hypothetical protein